MDLELNKWVISFGASGKKVTAVGFILLILIANFWLIKRFTGEPAPQWSADAFHVGVIIVFIGFFMMVPNWVNSRKTVNESRDDSENPNNDS